MRVFLFIFGRKSKHRYKNKKSLFYANFNSRQKPQTHPSSLDPEGELLHSPFGPRVRDRDDLSKRAFFYFKSKTEIWTTKDRNWCQPQHKVTFDLTDQNETDDKCELSEELKNLSTKRARSYLDQVRVLVFFFETFWHSAYTEK